MRTTRTTLALALLSGACVLPGMNQNIHEEGTVRTTLGNGMKVVLVEDHASPVVALNVWVRTGSADEQPGEFGMAHVFEHMLFKGTERRAVGEIAHSVEAAGGNINAFTSFDMTVYHITMASRDAEVGIDVLSDAVLHATFYPTELAREDQDFQRVVNEGTHSQTISTPELLSNAHAALNRLDIPAPDELQRRLAHVLFVAIAVGLKPITVVVRFEVAQETQ